MLTSTIVSIGLDSRLAGGTGERQTLRMSVVVTMCAGAFARRDDDELLRCSDVRGRRRRGRRESADLPIRDCASEKRSGGSELAIS